jgi:hypothetical protein
MGILLDENKKQKAIKLISLNSRNWSYIFELFKDEIFEMMKLKVPKTVIVKYLSNELGTNIKYTTFDSWLRKIKNQSYNNTLRNNSQIKKETSQQNNLTSNQEKKSKENQPWWEERLEELSKGMEKTALRL